MCPNGTRAQGIPPHVMNTTAILICNTIKSACSHKTKKGGRYLSGDSTTTCYKIMTLARGEPGQPPPSSTYYVAKNRDDN